MIHLEAFKYNKLKIDPTKIYRYMRLRPFPGVVYVGKFNLNEDIVLFECYERDSDDTKNYIIAFSGSLSGVSHQNWKRVGDATPEEIEIYELKNNTNKYNL